MIKDIVRLATMVMVIDNESDERETKLFQSVPKLMAQHLEGRSGVGFSIHVGTSVLLDKGEMDQGSEYNLDARAVADIANETIRIYNAMDEKDVSTWYKSICENIKGKWVRFHTLKLLVEIAAADKKIKDSELKIISNVAKSWEMEENCADFLFLKTGTEWVWVKDIFENTKKRTKYF